MDLRRLLRLPIRLRLATGYALFVVLVIGAVSLFLLATLEDNLQREADEALLLRASQLRRQIVADGTQEMDREAVVAALLDLAPLEEFSAPGIYVEILDPMGGRLASSPNLPGGELPAASELVASALIGRGEYTTVQAGVDRLRVLARPLENGGRVIGVMLVGESLHLQDTTLRRLRQLLSIGAIAAAITSLLGGWWFTGRALGPVAEVTRVARRIAATGRFEQRIAPPAARDELGELTATFNDMLDRLDRTMSHQREFLADVSHELRGPLMVIRGNLDLFRMGLPEEELLEAARDASEETERMTRLVSDLLFLAEADAEKIVEHRPVALHEVAMEVWERAKGLDDGSHKIVLDRGDSVTVQGDRHRLGQMLWNLVENALRYTPAGGVVTLSLRRQGPYVELAVADTGVGIPAEHLPRIFGRFYRVDRARSHGRGGTGLGLAIVKQIAEAHGGQVRVRSEPNVGSTFTVALPARQL